MKPHHGDPDQALDCFAQCAQGVRDASQVCRVPGRLPRPRQRPARGVRDASQVCRVPGRLPRPRQRPARPQTSARLLRAVRAASNKHSIGSAQCAQPQTSTRLASAKMFRFKQALDCFAQCARGVRDASQVCRVPGRLPRPRQRPAQPQTSTRLAIIHRDRIHHYIALITRN